MAELPSGAGYVIAAYAIAAMLYVGYWVRLRRLFSTLDKREREKQKA